MKRTVVAICLFLVAYRVVAQSSGTGTQSCANAQACAAAAQAFANAAQASATAADATSQDAVNTYNKDVANDASSAQQSDDYNVKTAALAAASEANKAADNAQKDAEDAQTYAANGDVGGAEGAVIDAANQQQTAADAAAMAVIINTNEGDVWGDPDNTLWGDDDTPVDIFAATDQAIAALGNDPGVIAAEQQYINNVLNTFNSTTPPATVVQGTSDGGGGEGAAEYEGLEHDDADDD